MLSIRLTLDILWRNNGNQMTFYCGEIAIESRKVLAQSRYNANATEQWRNMNIHTRLSIRNLNFLCCFSRMCDVFCRYPRGIQKWNSCGKCTDDKTQTLTDAHKVCTNNGMCIIEQPNPSQTSKPQAHAEYCSPAMFVCLIRRIWVMLMTLWDGKCYEQPASNRYSTLIGHGAERRYCNRLSERTRAQIHMNMKGTSLCSWPIHTYVCARDYTVMEYNVYCARTLAPMKWWWMIHYTNQSATLFGVHCFPFLMNTRAAAT